MATFASVIAVIAFMFTIIGIICLSITAYIFWQNRNLTLIRFRWPRSYIIWVILCNIYWISRIGYLFGDIYHLYPYEDGSATEIIMHCLRSIGLNGSYLIILSRTYLFYYTYAYDRHMLDARDATTSKIIRYRNILGNERYVLSAVFILIVISSLMVVLEETEIVPIEGFTQYYFGFCFCCFVILACFIPRDHDQLGLRAETIYYFIFGFIAFCGLMAIQLTLEDTNKRMLSYLGGTICLLLTNFICVYITMYQYQGYKYVLKRYATDLSEINTNYVELAQIVTHSRTYDAFRKFLADIFCVENLDFVIIVQQYRKFAENESLLGQNNVENEANESPQTDRKMETQISLRIRKKTKDQLIDDLVVEDNKSGGKSIDIKRLNVDFVQISNELKQLKDIKQWKAWIFSHYISNDGAHCLNVSSKLRKSYIQRHENEDMSDADLVSFYDEAQAQIWKLMAQDSMLHFRNSKIYKVTMWKQEDENDDD